MKRFFLFFSDASLLTTLYNGLFVLFTASIPLGTRTLIAVGDDPYQSVFLYFTDLLFVGLFLFWLANDVKNIVQTKQILLLLAFLIEWFFLAGIFSNDVPLGLHRFLKMAEYGFVFLIFFTHSFSSRSTRNVFTAILASGIIQSVLAIGQFISQRSFGLWWLGEQTLAPSLAGVAKIEVFGEKIIRAYGTLPHPNVLAVFLLLALFCAAFLLEKKKRGSLAAIVLLLSMPILTLGLLLTFSRTVIILGMAALGGWYGVSRTKERLRVAIVLAGSLIVFGAALFPYFSSRFMVASDNQSFSLRVFSFRSALGMIQERPFFGIGPGQFTRAQESIVESANLPPWANQPVHNIYVLLVSEAGIPALVFFCWFLFVLLMQLKREFRLLVYAFLIVGFFDHFFFTHQQGALLFWLVFGLAGDKRVREKQKNLASTSRKAPKTFSSARQ